MIKRNDEKYIPYNIYIYNFSKMNSIYKKIF